MELHLHDPVFLPDLADEEAEVRYEHIPDVVVAHDVVVGELVDEEVLLCIAGQPSDEPDPVWTPYLAAMPAHLRRISADTVLRMAVAHEMIGPAPRQRDAWSPLLAVFAHVFEQAYAQVTWQYLVGDDGPYGGAALLLPGGVVLHDDIDDLAGQHLVVLRNAAREVAHLMGCLDPLGRVAGPRIPRGRAAATEPTAATLIRASVRSRGRPERTLRATGSGEGLFVADERAGAIASGEQKVTGDTLATLVRELLA